MASSFQKFNTTVDYLAKGAINFNTDTLKAMLTNTAPAATNTTYSTVSGTELASGNGYTTGGGTLTGTAASNSSGVETVTASAYTWTSATGSMGPFRYVIIYDSTASGSPLVGFYDYGSATTLNGAAGETFTVTFTSGDLLTIQ